MKTLARIGATLSFTFFFLGGMFLLGMTNFRIDRENLLATVLGFFLLGIAFFVGPMLWLAAEKSCSKHEGR